MIKLPTEDHLTEKVSTRLKNQGYDEYFASLPIEEHLKRWERFIKECEEGYADVIEEYLNDLSARDILEEVGKILKEENSEAQHEFYHHLQKLDERFKSQLVETDQPIWGNEVTKDEGWSKEKEFWYFGRPKNVAKEFLHEFTYKD